jgi:hypothetical protein
MRAISEKKSIGSFPISRLMKSLHTPLNPRINLEKYEHMFRVKELFLFIYSNILQATIAVFKSICVIRLLPFVQILLAHLIVLVYKSGMVIGDNGLS